MLRVRKPDRRRALIALGAAVVAFDLALVLLDRKMQASGGPSILGFEFAGSTQRSTEILTQWGESGHDAARWSLWIDFGFMLSYGAFFTLAALATRDYAAVQGYRRFALLGLAAASAAASAAMFDAMENVFLLLILGGNGGELAPPAATICASIKFLLIGFSILYAIAGLALRVFARRARTASAPDPT